MKEKVTSIYIKDFNKKEHLIVLNNNQLEWLEAEIKQIKAERGLDMKVFRVLAPFLEKHSDAKIQEIKYLSDNVIIDEQEEER